MRLSIFDEFAHDPSIRGLSDGAFRLLVETACESARLELDGQLSDCLVRAHEPNAKRRKKRVDELVDAGLWRHVDGGYENVPLVESLDQSRPRLRLMQHYSRAHRDRERESWRTKKQAERHGDGRAEADSKGENDEMSPRDTNGDTAESHRGSPWLGSDRSGSEEQRNAQRNQQHPAREPFPPDIEARLQAERERDGLISAESRSSEQDWLAAVDDRHDRERDR